jgi:hypothetical protein
MSDWEVVTDDEPQLPARKVTFEEQLKAGLVKYEPRNVVNPEPLRHPAWQPAQPHELAPLPTVQQVVTVTTSATDRARGFHIQTVPLAAAFGFVAFLAAVLLFGNPVISAVSVITLFGVFAATWGMAFIWDGIRSPEFVAVLREFGILRLFGKEQDFRHDYIRHMAGMPPRKPAKGKGRK